MDTFCLEIMANEFDFEGWDDDDDDSEDHFPTDAEDDDFDIEAGE